MDGYRPVILTARDDNTVGAEITGSTGSPSGYYGDPMLDISYAGEQTISNFRISWAEQAVIIDNSAADFYDGQFVNCLNGVTGGFTETYFGNVLFANVLTNFDNFAEATVVAQNATFSGSACFWGQSIATPFTFGVTNCIFSMVTNFDSYPTSATNIVGANNGSYGSPWDGAGVYAAPGGAYPFETVGAAGYYLTSSSAFRGGGTTNIDPFLLSDLRARTTWPPIVYEETNISSLGVLGPQAQRDTNTYIDLGYHYSALDYVFGGCDLYSNLTVEAGTAVGWFQETNLLLPDSYVAQPYSISLNGGASLSFNGTASQPCYFANYVMVQEGANGNWTSNGYFGGIVFNGDGSPPVPRLSANFTIWTLDSGVDNFFRDDWVNGMAGFQNCEFYDGGISSYDMQYFDFTNCLFFRDIITLWGDQYNHAATSLTNENCTYYNGGMVLCRLSGESATFWQIENSAFDGTAFGTNDTYRGSTNYTFFNYNSYNTNNLSWQSYSLPNVSAVGIFETAGSNNLMVTNYNWQSGFLGDFYAPPTSPVTDRGSTNANLLGLYWFTTQTSQAIESNSTVDIGYHYVATDTNGNPLATYGTGVPNYILYPDGPPTNYLEIVTNPVSVTVTQGLDATFSVAAVGAPLPLSYQWFWNGSPLSDEGGVSGSESPTLNLSGVQPGQAGIYRVAVSNGSISSNSASVSLVVVQSQTNYLYPQYIMSPNAYWNVTDISDFSQPVKIGELQAPFSDPGYAFAGNGIPPFNTPWHTNTTITVTNAYGTAAYGGVSNVGTVYRINLTGSGITNIHTFTGVDGAYPCSQLAISGSTYYGISNTLYGTTLGGGSNGYGTVFKVNADGSDFTDLHEFTGGGDGKFPRAGLLLDGNMLYGTTTNSIFKIDTDGSGFTVLTNVVNASQLLLSPSGNVLYGTTSSGGLSNEGMLFSLSTAGSNFDDLYDFTGANGAPTTSGLGLYCVGNSFYGSNVFTLYGTTYSGGASNHGMVFSVNTDGTGFMDLHDFGGVNDGEKPIGGLLITNEDTGIGSYLFGTTSAGGTNGGGTVWSINLSNPNSSFQTIFSFTNQPASGSSPMGKLVYLGNTLYGTTSAGGAFTNGMIFSIKNNGTGFNNLHNFEGTNGGGFPLAGLALPVTDNPLSVWSLETTIDVSKDSVSDFTYSVAVDNCDALFVNGTLVSYTNETGAASWVPYRSISGYLRQGENDIRVIISAAGIPDSYDYFAMSMEFYPSLANVLYGTTHYGGTLGFGTVFKIAVSNEDTILHTFTNQPDGNYPIGDLLLSGDTLYGVTEHGGDENFGTIFSVSTNGSNYRVLHSFNYTSNDGLDPEAGLVLGGNTLYGTTSTGGPYYYGQIFSIDTGGSNYQALYNFGTNMPDGVDIQDGASPESPLLLVSNTLYGTANIGAGSQNDGTIFSISTNGSNYQTLYFFRSMPFDGYYPVAGLTMCSNILYGTTTQGGSNGVGTIFMYNLNNSNYQSVYSFGNSPDGANPDAGLVLSGNTLYGTTFQGGTNGFGTLYSIGLDGNEYTNLLSFGSTNSDFGQYPKADLLILGNSLFGTTYQGGNNGYGIVFGVNTNGANFNDLYDFILKNGDGQNPWGGLCSP
jgi:uncharacterized repeat protein (TIGR03803 family)